MSEVKIFLSYSWEDSNEADQICDYFSQKYNIKLQRDTIDIDQWKSIKEYMQSIDKMDYIILLISDSYLKSANCMYEVLQVIRDRDYKDKIFPAIIETKIYNPYFRIDYVRYWEEEYVKFNEKLTGISTPNLGNLSEELKRRQYIASNMADFLATVSDMNNPQLKDICIEIEKKLEEKNLIDFKMNRKYLFTLNNHVKIRTVIIAVGGAGINIINKIIGENVQGIKCIAIDTDKRALQSCQASECIHIGSKNGRNIDVNTKLKTAEKAAEENSTDIVKILKGADLVFIICGMGGDTGTGVAPVIAKLSKEMGILTIGMVTKPFYYEGHKHIERSIISINKMIDSTDSLIVISNDMFYEFMNLYFTVSPVFMLTDTIFLQTISAMIALLNMPETIRIDFKDICDLMKNKGIVYFGIGKGKGDNRVRDAVKMAVEIPFLEMTISEASHALVYVSGDITLADATEAASYVQKRVGDDIYIMFGAIYDDTEIDNCIVIVLATGMK